MDAARPGANHCPQRVGIVAVAATAANSGWWSPTAPDNVTSSNTDVMNQLCRVCGEPAAGFHFGAFTCEGCKSFFGRTYNNVGSISECKNGGVCVINKKNRTACKACRLRKCLMVGMSKSGSRYGRRSNWFKIHCLLQEHTHQAQTRIKDSKSIYEKAFSSLDVANNNNNDNTNVNNNGTSIGNVNSGNDAQERLLVKRISESSRSRELSQAPRMQDVFQSPEAMRANDILRPETTRFPMWRSPSFFHPALSPMQLLNANPFFSFQQRFAVPYMNQTNTVQPTAFSSSSESVSPRSTPSPEHPQQQQFISNAATTSTSTTPVTMLNQYQPKDIDINTIRNLEDESHYDESVAFLKTLGPEQEEPMDLSTKPEPAEDRVLREENLSLLKDDSDVVVQTKPPLDLTRKT